MRKISFDWDDEWSPTADGSFADDDASASTAGTAANAGKGPGLRALSLAGNLIGDDGARAFARRASPSWRDNVAPSGLGVCLRRHEEVADVRFARRLSPRPERRRGA